jgi:hypothetical protein
MSYILSFDCAHKSLAYSYVCIDPQFREKSAELSRAITAPNISAERVAQIRTQLNTLVQILNCGSADLLEGQQLCNVGPSARTLRLAQFLVALSDTLNPRSTGETLILIEMQPSKLGGKSPEIEYQIMMYYTLCGCQVRTISPKLKNKLHFCANLAHDAILADMLATAQKNNMHLLSKEQIARVKYRANKKHSRENFLYFANRWPGGPEILRTLNRAHYADIADSFMQIFAFFIYVN